MHTVQLRDADVAFVVHPVMRSLRQLAGVDAATLRWLIDHAAQLPRTLAEIVLEVASSDLAWAWHRLDGVPAIRRLALLDPEQLSVVRDGDGRLSILRTVYRSALFAVLDALPGDTLTSVHIHAVPTNLRAELDAALARQQRLQHVSITSARPDAPDD